MPLNKEDQLIIKYEGAFCQEMFNVGCGAKNSWYTVQMTSAKHIIIILIALCFLLFLVGFNLGKKIQRMDQVYIPPTKAPTQAPTQFPTLTPPLQSYKEYTVKGCGVSFLYPDTYKAERVSSTEASLSHTDGQIFVSCNQKTVSDIQKKLSKAEKSGTFESSEGKITVYKLEDLDAWTTFNPSSSKRIIFEVSPHLTKLITKTLQLK